MPTCNLVVVIERIVYVSVESTRIIEGLQTELIDRSSGYATHRQWHRV